MPVNDRRLENWRGATEIGARFEALMKTSGRSWSVDQLVSDLDRHVSVLEWTSFNKERDRLVRGVDWFDFEPQTDRIAAVRSFIAAVSNPEAPRVEQQDFDYAGKGYPTL